MSKKTAGERKRNVAVVIGPKTEKLIAELCGQATASMMGLRPSCTDMCGAALNLGLAQLAKSYDCSDGGGGVDHFE